MAIAVINEGINRISILTEMASTGWTVSNGQLIHEEGKEGFAVLLSEFIEQGKVYKIRYTVDSYDSGILIPLVGTTAGIQRNAAGTFEEEIEALEDGSISFFSNGEISISYLFVSQGKIKGETMVFSEKGMKWAGSYGFVPDKFIRYKGMLFAHKDATLYEHNKSNKRNEFYGEKFPSKIRFVSNDQYRLNKVFFGIKIDSVGAWQVDRIRTNKTDQFPNGMESRLPVKNIKLMDGKYWADFFRDMRDPSFAHISDTQIRELKSLNDGRMLQGNYLEIEMSCDTEKELKLVSVSIFSSPVGRN
ncbi:hypothetical protein [Sphingobacterium detergens]|uniref:hypothetical protein n=1 Tax=Sphingobacterium detergens TaxID=1145106 RepID=UPI003AB007FB